MPGGTLANVTGGLGYATAAGRWVLAATVLGSGIAALDSTVVGIALPAIGRDFHASVAGMQWVIDGYTLPLAGLLLLGGALGDVYGRRKIFVIGTIWFAIASLACGLAPSAGFLIAARAVQGVGAALLTPGSLAILQASFNPDDRARAIGAWSGLGGVATAIGPFLGGWLIGAVSWRLVFFINLPLAAAVVAIALRHVPESRAPGPRQPLDVPGAMAISLSLAGITYGLIEASAHGWTSPQVLASLIAGVVLLAAFCVIETRSSHPMLPLGVFRSRQFSAANAVTFVVYGALGGALFLVPVVLQEVSGYSPLAAGAALLPLTVIMLLLSARSAALSARIGPRLQMTVGPLLIAAGMLLFTRVQGDGNYVTEVLPAVLVLGLGLATNVAPLTATALSAAPAEHSGIASAVNNDVARSASLIAVAVLPTLAGLTGDAYLHPAALTQGFHTAMTISAVAAAAGGILAVATIRNPLRRARPQAEPAPSGRPVPGGTVPAGTVPAGATAAGATPAGATAGEGAVSYLHCCALDGPPLATTPHEPQQPQ
ncbi:DHA2 family efflux MFS transporter permease subunit [Trebonia kvetii]|uniref:DHA2 family efflux MFS transporter permease subunit n=1 Tax=Trebonia kvetii TaxID=2480626 RepID=A0A6P2BXW5_9ACTN|nr:DHA2 family efflux MFS transporter permease subunit [Trebonia kvetii]